MKTKFLIAGLILISGCLDVGTTNLYTYTNLENVNVKLTANQPIAPTSTTIYKPQTEYYDVEFFNFTEYYNFTQPTLIYPIELKTIEVKK